MQRWTERQLILALTWISLEWNNPDRHDHYIMRLEQSMLQMMNSKRVRVKPIKFKYRTRKRKLVNPEDREDKYDSKQAVLDVAKGMAFSQSTMPVTVQRISKDGTRVLSERLVDPRTGEVIPGSERKFE